MSTPRTPQQAARHAALADGLTADLLELRDFGDRIASIIQTHVPAEWGASRHLTARLSRSATARSSRWSLALITPRTDFRRFPREETSFLIVDVDTTGRPRPPERLTLRGDFSFDVEPVSGGELQNFGAIAGLGRDDVVLAGRRSRP